MKKTILFKTMLLLCALIVGNSSAWAEEVIDELDNAFTGVTGSSYSSWSGKTSKSSAVYAGNSAGSNSTIQLRSSNNNAGVVTTASGGKVKSITVTWNSGTADARILNIYGKNEAYEAATDLYNSTKQGTLLGALKCEDADKGVSVLTIEGDYEFIGFRSASGALYLDKVEITWETGDPSAPTATLSTTALNFGKVNYGETKDLTFTVTPANLTGDLTITCDNSKYVVTPTTIASSVAEETTITVTAKPTAVDDNMDGTITISGGGLAANKTVTLTTTVVDPNVNDGSEEKPFTVAEAKANTPASGTSENYYIKGIVSAFYADNIISDGNNYRYYISDDGTTTDQLLVYKGKNLNNVAFSEADDITVGDEVVIYGGLTMYSNEPEIASGNYIYSTTHPQKQTPELVVNNLEMEVTTTLSVDGVYTTNSNGTVEITSDNEAVVKVEDGFLKALSVGSAEITVSVAKTKDFLAASDHFTVTVNAREGVAPEGIGAGTGYFLVTDASTLNNNDNIIIVGQYDEDSYYALSTTQNNNNRGEEPVTVSGNVIKSISDEVQVITLEGETDAWYFNVGDGYLYAASNSSNHLKTEAEKDANNNAKAKITIDGGTGNATIKFQGSNSRNELRYNGTSNIFSCYASNSTTDLPQIYRLNEGGSTFNIAVSAAGWRGLVTAVDATLPETLTAYTVTAYNESTATLTKVDAVKANTPYIVKGNKGTYTLTVAEEEVEAPENNLLQISTKNTGNGVYVLYNGASGVGFYLWSGGSLGAGRVYLPAIVNAREFIGLDSETTGISTVNSEAKSLFNGEFFNMAGQRVAKPAKGLYIVNGKKVVIK